MATATIHFYTLPFFQELARRLSADADWAARLPSRDVRIVCSAPDKKRAFLLEVKGSSVTASEATSATTADFHLEGSYDAWASVCRGEVEIDKLVRTGKIRIAGSMPDIMGMMGPLNHMVVVARTFPKEF